MSENTVRGTAAELAAMGLTINGIKLDQTTFSILTRLGYARKVGEKEKPARGKAATIWELDSETNLTLKALVPSVEVSGE